MNLQEIAKSVVKADRELIKKAVEENKSYKANFSQHKGECINNMYSLWDKYFPTQKQDINCSSCRNAVVKFWSTMCEEWLKENTKKKKNVNKTK
jgi:hypothetical protein